MREFVRVLFRPGLSSGWLGGVSYYRNLFHAMSMVSGPALIPLVDTYGDMAGELDGLSCPAPYRDRYRRGPKYYVKALLNRILGMSYNLEASVKRQREFVDFDVSSHVDGRIGGRPSLAWIPDFQHLRLPEMFSDGELELRNRNFHRLAERNDIVFLSSEDAMRDFAGMMPRYAGKARVLRFMSYFSPGAYRESDILFPSVREKYRLPESYFFLPNQFWRHKDHITVFRALSILKERGVEANVVCTGHTYDHRNPDHFDLLLRYIEENDLHDRVRILGVVGRQDLVCLMRYSVAVINPSLFEGWSTVVEECRSIGKGMVLSDIPVHLEQDPPGAVFFRAGDFGFLADVLGRLVSLPSAPDGELEHVARESMAGRMRAFGETYRRYVMELL